MKRLVMWSLTGLLLLVVGAQLVPYGRDHDNPPVAAEPVWDTSTTRELARRACFDCHSNETKWPWYSNIAPLSWLIQRDVEEGRDELNWSEWDLRSEGDESAETVIEGSMPPGTYSILHPEARLSDQEIDALVAGLVATFGSDDAESDNGDEGSDNEDEDEDDDD
jgi:mono/diheme cytochrome c family protein